MKTIPLLTTAAFAFAILVGPAFAADPLPSASPVAKQYTCTMHPEVVKDIPGNCPKCGMKLVEKKSVSAPAR